MSKLFVCAVLDTAANAFVRPVFVPQVAVATRGFRDEVNRKDSELGQHPEDYHLYTLGLWDEESGLFETGSPVLVVRAQDCKEI